MENLISENTMKKEEICMKLKCIKILVTILKVILFLILTRIFWKKRYTYRIRHWRPSRYTNTSFC